MNVDGRDVITNLIDWHREQTAHNMLKVAFMAAGLNGKIATHSLRKFFAQ